MVNEPLDQFQAKLIHQIPEIGAGYERLKRQNLDSLKYYSSSDIAELNELRDQCAPETSLDEPGITLILEDLLIPFIVDLAVKERGGQRMKEVFEFIETAAAGTNFVISNAIAVSICEPLITTHEEHLVSIFPYMGKRTRELCKLQFDRWRLSVTTIAMFKDV